MIPLIRCTSYWDVRKSAASHINTCLVEVCLDVVGNAVNANASLPQLQALRGDGQRQLERQKLLLDALFVVLSKQKDEKDANIDVDVSWMVAYHEVANLVKHSVDGAVDSVAVRVDVVQTQVELALDPALCALQGL